MKSKKAESGKKAKLAAAPAATHWWMPAALAVAALVVVFWAYSPGPARALPVRRHHPAVCPAALRRPSWRLDAGRSSGADVHLLAERAALRRRHVLLSRRQCPDPLPYQRAGLSDRAPAAGMERRRSVAAHAAGRVRRGGLSAAPRADRSGGLPGGPLRSAQRDVRVRGLHSLPLPARDGRRLERRGSRTAAVRAGAALQGAYHCAAGPAAADRFLVEPRLLAAGRPRQLEALRADGAGRGGRRGALLAPHPVCPHRRLRHEGPHLVSSISSPSAARCSSTWDSSCCRRT